MSAFIGVADHKGIVVASDGAGYDALGVIRQIGRKVSCARNAPLAITTRGHANVGRLHQKRLCTLADQFGVDEAITRFGEELPDLVPDPDADGLDQMHWYIAAWSESRGPIHLSANNLPHGFEDGREPPYVLVEQAKVYCAGTPLTMEALFASGVTPIAPGECQTDYLKRVAVPMMEAMRRIPGRPPAGGEWEGDQYVIGGHVDLTVVDRTGARTRTVHRWPEDHIGERINPFFAANVTPLAHMSRSDRRRAEKVAKKGRAA